MRWLALTLAIVLAGCANGKILDVDAPHDNTAAFLDAHTQAKIRIRPMYGDPKTWTPITERGLWVSEGHYFVQGLCLDRPDRAELTVERLALTGGHIYVFDCAGSDGSQMVISDLGERQAVQ